jgi:hypothetical protein
VWRPLAATGLALAGLTGLGYAGWLLTARRGLFAGIAAAGGQDATVSLAGARGSDALDAGWFWATVVLYVVALLLWAGAWYVGGQRLGPVGFAGLSMVASGLLAAGAGSALAWLSGGDTPDAGGVAIGCSVIGVGFALMSGGLFTGVASLIRERPAEGTSYLGYAGWSAG